MKILAMCLAALITSNTTTFDVKERMENPPSMSIKHYTTLYGNLINGIGSEVNSYEQFIDHKYFYKIADKSLEMIQHYIVTMKEHYKDNGQFAHAILRFQVWVMITRKDTGYTGRRVRLLKEEYELLKKEYKAHSHRVRYKRYNEMLFYKGA